MRVGVVGGGITGLTVAEELLRRGHEVTVLTKGGIGGLAGGFPCPERPGVYLDRFYHHVFTSDTAVIRLIEQHGLAGELVWLPSRSGLVVQGKVWPFRGPADLLRFSPLGSFRERLRMGWNLWRLKQANDWRPLDTVTCREFFEQRGSLAGYRNLWQPLLEQKFADAHDRIPASFLWGRVRPRAGSRSFARECLGYLRGGFRRLFEAMAAAIRSGGGEVLTRSLVRSLQPGPRPELAGHWGRRGFDRVVWTASLPELLAAVGDPPADFARRAGAVKYMAVTELILVMKRRQSDYYWLNNIDPANTFGGIIEHTNFVSPEEYGGGHILYVVNYHRPDDPRFAGKSSRAVFEGHLHSLERTLPRFRREDVVHRYGVRALYASPLYDLGFAARVPPYRGWLAGVDICTQAQVYPHDRNMSHCAENALRYVRQLDAET